MSIMGINFFLMYPWNMAVTAMFAKCSLLFIKPLGDMINDRGMICKSNLAPFLCLRMILQMLTSPVAFIMRLNPQGRVEIPLSSLIGGLGE